jgi:hypothetical protein
MNDLVELILKTYQSMCPLDIERAADSRQNISRYIETLASAGQRDAPAEYTAGLELAISRGWLKMHESGTFVTLTQSGLDVFA